MPRFLDRLRPGQLAALAAALFVVDLLIPDPLPFLDEAVLGVLAYLLARRKSPPPPA